MVTAATIIDAVKRHKVFAFDIEHDPALSCHRPGFRLHGCSFATEGVCEYLRDPEQIAQICKSLFVCDDIEAIAYNGKYDLKCLRSAKLIGETSGEICGSRLNQDHNAEGQPKLLNPSAQFFNL